MTLRTNNLYVACIDLTGKRCLVVGGGPVALEKIEGLLAAGAAVTVVAPDALVAVHTLAADGAIELVQREYESGDLDGCFLAIAATSTTPVNEAVHRDAEARSMLINVADVPHLCNFILPAIVREGPVAVAISTAGASPALAQRMKREAAEVFGAPYVELAALLEEVRSWAKGLLPTYQDRKEFFDSIVNGDPDPIALLRENRTSEVRRIIGAAQARAEQRFLGAAG